MFKYDYKYAILLDRLRNGEVNSDTLYSGGGVYHPFRWTFFTSYIPYIQKNYIDLLSYVITYM